MHAISPALKQASQQLLDVLETRTPNQKWTVKLTHPWRLLVRRPKALMCQAKGQTDRLTPNDEALLHDLFDDSPHYTKGSQGRVSAFGLSIQARPELLPYAVYLDACLAQTGHLPPTTLLDYGRWAFPGNRDPELERRFQAGLGQPLAAFMRRSFWASQESFDPLYFSRRMNIECLDGVSVKDYITQHCGADVAAYAASFI